MKNQIIETITLILILIFLLVSIYTHNFSPLKYSETKIITIKEGDILWNIGREEYDGDVRIWLHEVKKLNNWNEIPVIHPGDKIKIPKLQQTGGKNSWLKK